MGFQVLSSSGEKEFTEKQVASAMLTRCSTGFTGSNKGLNYLRQIFIEADKDGNGELDMQEMRMAFCTDKVAQRLHKLKLPVPDWLRIFAALDLDKNGMLSWDEISQGVRTIWDSALEDQLRDQAGQADSKDTRSSMAMTKKLSDGTPKSAGMKKLSGSIAALKAMRSSVKTPIGKKSLSSFSEASSPFGMD